jgi:hypothetical protein
MKDRRKAEHSGGCSGRRHQALQKRRTGYLTRKGLSRILYPSEVAILESNNQPDGLAGRLGKRGDRVEQPTADFFQLAKEEKPSFSELPVTIVPRFIVFYFAPKRGIESLASRRADSAISDIFNERTHSLAKHTLSHGNRLRAGAAALVGSRSSSSPSDWGVARRLAALLAR